MHIFFRIAFSILILNSTLLTAFPRINKIEGQSIIKQFAKRKSAKKGRWIAKKKVYLNDAGYFFITSDFARPTGYRGATAILIWLSSDKKRIRKATLIASDDTPAYIRQISKKKHLQKYTGCSVVFLSRKQNTNSLDIVSGATRSCDGIYFSIVQALQKVIPLLK